MTGEADPAVCPSLSVVIGRCEDFEAPPRWCCPLPLSAVERVDRDLEAARADYRHQPHPEGGYWISLAYTPATDALSIVFMPKAGFTGDYGLYFTHEHGAPSPEGHGSEAHLAAVAAEEERVLTRIREQLSIAVGYDLVSPYRTPEEAPAALLRDVLDADGVAILESQGINPDAYNVVYTIEETRP